MCAEGNQTDENWVRAQTDLAGALGNGNLLLQAILYPGVDVGNDTATSGLLNVTAEGKNGTAIKLPYSYPNGTDLYLGNDEFGFPPQLYPNLTYSGNTSTARAEAFYAGEQLDPREMLLLGPLIINDSYALLSATVGVINNTSREGVLGWLTIVVDASMIFDIQESPEGLGRTGEVLIVGPTNANNQFPVDPKETAAASLRDHQVKFILPPKNDQNRHRQRSTIATAAAPFPMSQYPAIVSAWSRSNGGPNNAGAYISTKNEDDDTVSAGYAVLSTPFVDWVLVVEQSRGEVVAPINHLRDVVLICVFSVIGALLLIIFPLAHYSIAPIRQLRAATQKTVEPYQPDDSSIYSSSTSGNASKSQEAQEKGQPAKSPAETNDAKGNGFLGVGKWSLGQSNLKPKVLRRRPFRIPSKVPERKHWVTDELTDLTSTFNEMADELTMQYERLEERVKERTAELEKSKKAAESANQSKTLFIANISHELKTPLNGILGLATVCMAEDDMNKVRSTLSTIYKSGDLLLHLLTDLLTFSKNEVGQQLSIDEAEFRINDLSLQLMPTFEKQAREAQVDLRVDYVGTADAYGDTTEFSGEKAYGPVGTGLIRNMCLWGDKNRILQVLMNFVSNSLKFTPARGSVTVRIRCVGLLEQFPSRASSVRKASVNSRKSRSSSGKKVRISDASLHPGRDHSGSEHDKSHSTSRSGEESKLSINVAGGTTHIAKIAERRRSMSPPPLLNTKDLAFEFEVEDTGPGIPEDQQKKIFEPFVQGDLGLSKKYGGTGLGLSICAQLASLMGGEISLDSKIGHGSKFTMRIPLRYLSERAASTASSHRSHSKASSLIGQPLHDDDPVLHHPHGGSTTSLASTHAAHDEKYRQPGLADVPRIVGFSQPYVAKDSTAEDKAQARLKEMRKVESEAVKQGKKVRVLVAEDNPVNQEVVLRMLKLEDVYGRSHPVHFLSEDTDPTQM